MRKLTFFATLAFILSSTSTAQWILENPSTTDHDLYSIHSIDNFHWSVGVAGTIVFSSDNGANWNAQNCNVNYDLKSVFFINSDIGWIVGNEGTILRTTDGGGDWELIPTITDYHLNSVFFVTENIGWAAGGIQVGMNTNSITLKTTDGGLNWFEQYNSSTNIYSINFLDTSTGWSVGYNIHFNGSRIKKTTDSGMSWINKSPSFSGHYRDIYFINNDVGFCVGEEVIKTTDGGDNWTIINGGFSYTEKVRFANENIGWILSDRSAFRTLDGGNNWIEFDLPELKSSFYNFTNYNSISITDTNTIYVAGDNGTLIKSADLGVSWEILSGILNDLFEIQFVNSLNGFIAASNGNIFRTINGGLSWLSTVTPTTNDVLNLKMISPSIGFATTNNEILKTLNGGQTWSKQSFTPNHQTLTLSDIYFVDNMNGWACGNYSTILHSSNGGQTWQVQLEDNGTAVITSIYFHDEFNGLAIGNSYGQTGGWSYFLFNTTSGGNNWISNDLEIEGYGDSKILFFNELDGWLLLSDRLMFTSDGGESWDLKFTANDLIASLGFSVANQNSMWITTWYGVILNSTNGGETWGIQRNYNELSHHLRSINMYDDQIGWIVGSPNVIYKTVNGGQSIIEPPSTPILSLPANGSLISQWFGYVWIRPDECVSTLQISTDINFNNLEFEGRYIFDHVWSSNTCSYKKDTKYYWRVKSENQLGFSEWSEIWHFTTNILLEVEEENKLQHYSLLQNYPNPFNPITTIKYEIQELSFVTLKIYDVLGQEIITIVNEEQPAGGYEVEFNGTSLSSGIYFYRLQAGDFAETKKMVLLR